MRNRVSEVEGQIERVETWTLGRKRVSGGQLVKQTGKSEGVETQWDAKGILQIPLNIV